MVKQNITEICQKLCDGETLQIWRLPRATVQSKGPKMTAYTNVDLH